MDAPRAEAARDQGESAFTPILRRCFQDVPRLLAAVFVDAEGECIDYVSAIDPFEAKVAAAHMHNAMSLFRWARASRSLGSRTRWRSQRPSARSTCAAWATATC